MVGSLNLDSLTIDNGFTVKGKFQGDKLGFRISSVYDFNGDGIDDLAISTE
jgi:FG-GAP repeat